MKLRHAVCATTPSVLSTDAVNFKPIYYARSLLQAECDICFDFQPSQCLYYVIIIIIAFGVSLFRF